MVIIFSKDEKVEVLKHRVEVIRFKVLMGLCDGIKGQEKIGKLNSKIERLSK